jgi:tol-pal system protein YbgF
MSSEMKFKYGLFSLLVIASTAVLANQSAPVISINQSASSLMEQLQLLERKLDARNKAQVVIQQQLDDLQNEVNELRGVTELHSHQLSQVIERQRELYQELDRRVNQALAQKQKEESTVTSSSVSAGQAITQQSTSTVDYSGNLSENELYDHAVNLVLKDKKYDQAIVEFQRFNQQFPQSSYAANVHYWLGQLLFTKNELKQAQQEFQLVVEKYQQSTKRADAMLKLAIIAHKLDNIGEAKRLYQQVISNYPNTSSAQLASSRLSGL